MSTLTYILIFTFLGSVGSLIGGMILLLKEKFALKVSHFLASFAAGTLLGAAFFDLLPEAAHEAEVLEINIFIWVLIGIVSFFLLERFIHWFHHHDAYHDTAVEGKTTVPLIIVSDTIHNFLDGVVIAATFLVDIQLGMVTTIAVAAHEIPQEIGDFGLLLHKGMERKNIILVNVFSALAALTGALITYMLGNIVEQYIPIFLSLTAGFFMYIALSDLIPEIHHEKRKGFAVRETVLLFLGILFVWFSVTYFGQHE